MWTEGLNVWLLLPFTSLEAAAGIRTPSRLLASGVSRATCGDKGMSARGDGRKASVRRSIPVQSSPTCCITSPFHKQLGHAGTEERKSVNDSE